MSDFPSQRQMRAFLRDLAAITEKHGVAVGGCGCCGSPSLELAKGPGRYSVGKRDNGSLAGDCLTWRPKIRRRGPR